MLPQWRFTLGPGGAQVPKFSRNFGTLWSIYSQKKSSTFDAT